MYLVPDKVDIIPVSPLTEGFDKQQQLAINIHEYPSPSSSSLKKIVFLFSHANGLCKECFHPIMRRLIDYLRNLTEYDHTDITFISWDGRNQGDSALLNEGTLSSSYSWIDHSLDMKQIVDFYNLKEDSNQLIGVGHSYSATCMILLEFHFPETFDGLCLFEPGLSPNLKNMETFLQLPYLISSATRREEWLNRQTCAEYLIKKKVYERFHPETFDLYLDYGMYEAENGRVRLKCPKNEEMHINYSCHKPTYSAVKMLESLTIPTHIVLAIDSHSPPLNFEAFVKPNITKRTIKGTHMLPNESPESTIPQIKFLMDRMNGRFRADFDSKI